MNQQPQVKLPRSNSDRWLEGAAWIIVTLNWLTTILAISYLPERVPTHFNIKGLADGWGSPYFILPVPMIASLLVAAMTWLNHYPHAFNYAVKITPENAFRQYTNATRLIRILNLTIAIIFLGISLMMTLSAAALIDGPGIWILPVILLLVYAPLAVFIYRSFKMK